MKEAQIDSKQALVTDHQSAEIAQPGESPLDFPSMLVSLLDFWRLFLATFAVSALKHQEANSLACQSASQFVRIISLIGDQALGPALGAATTRTGHFNGL